MGSLLLRILFGWLDGVDTLSEPGIHHLPMEKKNNSVTDVLYIIPFLTDT